MSTGNHWHEHYQLLKNYLDSNFKFLFQTTLTKQTLNCSNQTMETSKQCMKSVCSELTIKTAE